MHANAAEAARPAENELLRKLDTALRDRAMKIVDAGLKEAEAAAVGLVAESLSGICGHVIKGDVIRHFSEACTRIRANAIERAYQDLLERVANQLADGKPVDLSI